MKVETGAGVIIGRFQVPELHKGQRRTIEDVLTRHRTVIILVGVSPVKGGRINPLDFETRAMMIRSAFPKAIIHPIRDYPSDVEWSNNVDSTIQTIIGDKQAILYGSRDSFIPHYQGRYKTIELPARVDMSGTEARKAASDAVRAEKGFRVGIIYGAWHNYPTSFQTVDAIIHKAETNEILLGRKATDPIGKWRFIGGFVSPEDPSLEAAAMREAMEETGGLGLEKAVYLFSMRVDDWRYRKERDKIMTAVFRVPYVFGQPRPTDDIDALQWFGVPMFDPKTLVAEHIPLWEEAKRHFNLTKGD